MPAGYPDFSWSIRIARTLIVVAVALLFGAVIGGASVHLISDALTAPPSVRADASASKAVADNAAPAAARPASQPNSATSAEGKSVRTIDPALPAPTPSPPAPSANAPVAQPSGDGVASQSPAVAAQPSSSPAAASAPSLAPQEHPQIANPQTAAQPVPQSGLARKSWPDAVSRMHPSTAVAPDSALNDANNPPAARATTPNETGSADKSMPVKKLTASKAITRRTQDAARDVRQDGRRPIYDYYGKVGDGDRQDAMPAPERVVPGRMSRSTGKTKALITVRQQDNSDQSDDHSNEAGRILPPQPPPAQSFLGGLFGGDRNDHWQSDDRDR
jgi:hypothetical protein